MFCQSALSSADYVKVSIIGTYHSVFDDAHDVFKRGVDTFPQIESKCYCVSSVNLQNFMNVLSRNIDSDKRLKISRTRLMQSKSKRSTILNALLKKDGNMAYQSWL